MKQITALLLAALLVMMTSCGSTETKTDTTAGSENTQSMATEAPVETTPAYDTPDLPETDLAGYTFRILTTEYDASLTTSPLLSVTEENGEIINDVIFQRNLILTEAYNFVIEQNINTNPAGTLKSAVNAGDDLCDIAFYNLSSGVGQLTSGLFYDLYKLENIDLSKNYHDQSMVRDLSINGKYYFVSGDIHFCDDDALMVTMYNRAMAENHGIDVNFYDLAYDGKWTLDVMYAYMKTVVQDTDNNAKYDENDICGFAFASDAKIMPYLGAAGVRIVEKDENDIPYLTTNTERAQAVYDKIQMFMTQPGIGIDWTQDTANTVPVLVSMVDNGHILFQNMILSQIRRFYRDVENDFGLLPMPKLDESQTEYYSTYNSAVIQVGYVPVTLSEAAKTGFIIEALSGNSRELTNSYYEVCLQSKYTRDEESYDMIEIAKSNVVLDLAYIYNLGDFTNKLTQEIRTTGNFQSTFASYKEKIISDIEKNIGK